VPNLLKEIKNIVYTIAERRNIKVIMKGGNSFTYTKKVTIATLESFTGLWLSVEEALPLIIYAAAHEGAHVKLSNINNIRNLLKYACIAEKADFNTLNGLIQVSEDYRVDYNITKSIPKYWEIRKKGIESANILFESRFSKNKNDNLFRAVSFFTYDSDLRNYGWKNSILDWNLAYKTAEDLKQIATVSNSSLELSENTYSYYKRNFSKRQV